jgi:hypothetical protein
MGAINVLASTVGAGLQWNSVTEQIDINGLNLNTSNITESNTNLYFTTERAQDAASALFTPNTGHEGISFLYDDTTGKIYATVTNTGLTAVVNDSNPQLGGNLSLDGYAIVGAGNIAIEGSVQSTGITTTYIQASTLGASLDLDSYNITGLGNITITGNITATNISGVLTAKSYATVSLPAIPLAGWIVFDTTLKQFKGYTGTEWVVLG